MMRIVVCDDQRMVADALASLLESWGHEVAGIALDPDQAIALAGRRGTDVFLTEVSFWEGGHQEPAVASLRRAAPEVPIVVLTGSTEMMQLEQALACGAIAIVRKSDDARELSRILAGVEAARHKGLRRGDRDLWSSGTRALFASKMSRRTAGSLTSRERQVLEGLVQGQGTAELSRVMGVQVSTLRTHVRSILTKLGVHSRLELVAYAIREGLVPAERVTAAPRQRREPFAG
ncbi:MAG: response regulator transcription factor [Acidimicrobiales bacterium]